MRHIVKNTKAILVSRSAAKCLTRKNTLHHSTSISPGILFSQSEETSPFEKIQSKVANLVENVMKMKARDDMDAFDAALEKDAPQNADSKAPKPRSEPNTSEYAKSLEEALTSNLTGIKQKRKESSSSGSSKSSSPETFYFSAMQYESTVESLKQQALKGNVSNMLLIYNFLYNHGECQENIHKHAALLRIVFMGFVHAKEYATAELMLTHCFEWVEKVPEHVRLSRTQEEKRNVERSIQQLNQEFRDLILPNHDQIKAPFPIRSFFHCEHKRIPMHPHILNQYFDALAGQQDVEKIQSTLDWVKTYSLRFLEPDMSSLYCSLMLAEISKENYTRAQEIFHQHFISPLSKNSETLLEITNAAARERAGRKVKSSALDMESESDFRIEPNNLDVAEPSIYAYSMLITSFLMQNQFETAIRVTDFLYSIKYYNVIVATQALLAQTKLYRTNEHHPFSAVQKTWQKYFDPRKLLEQAKPPQGGDANQDTSAKEETLQAKSALNVAAENPDSVSLDHFLEAIGDTQTEGSTTEKVNNKVVPDSRAVAIYLSALLQAQETALISSLLDRYSEIYVPDSISLQLTILNLLYHATKDSHLPHLSEARFFYDRYVSTENPKQRNPMRLPIKFYMQVLVDLDYFLQKHPQGRTSVLGFMEMCIKDCFHHYTLKDVGTVLVQKAEAFGLGHLVRKKKEEENAHPLFAYVPPQQILNGLPKNLQIYAAVREREYAFSVSEFVSLISLGKLDEMPIKDQEKQLVNIIKLHLTDPTVGNLLFHYNPEHPPRNGESYSMVCGVKSFGDSSEDFIISVPWTIKLVDMGILKLKDPKHHKTLQRALETWADYELAWFSLEDKRATFPAALSLNTSISAQQMQILTKYVKGSESMREQITEAERELEAHGLSFPSRAQLVEVMSLLRCALQQVIDNGIREVLMDSTLSRHEQDEKILRNLRRFCPDQDRLLYTTRVMRGVLNPDEVNDILLQCVCMPAPIIQQNQRAKELLTDHRISLPQPIAVRMKEEREKANVLNSRVCPPEVRVSVYDQCVMLPCSKGEQNNEAMRILCDLGYTLGRQSVERGMRDARDRLRHKKRPFMVGGMGRVIGM